MTCPFELRPYQLECLDLIKKEIKKGTKNILIQAATGAGKTVILSRLINDLNVKALVVVNKRVLVDQTVSSLKRYVSDIGVYSASHGMKDLSCRWNVASIQSLIRNKEDKYFDLIIADECHSINLNHFNEIKYKNLVGVTATPFTGKGNFIFGEGKFFNRPIFKATFKSLTDAGYLAPIRTKGSAKRLDVSDVSLSSTGDYNQKELEAAVVGQYKTVEKQVKDALSRSQDRKKVAFVCCNIKHCEMVFNLLPPGSASMTHSKMSQLEQKDNIERFEKGYRRFLVSVMQISTGYDYPPLDCLVLMRPTRSPVLYCQSVGRIARTSPGKDYGLLLDYGGVVETMGSIYKVNIKASGEADNSKMCTRCEEMNDMTAAKCSQCSEPFMVMCKQCLDMIPYGEKCLTCPTEIRKIDFTKNLTEKAWTEGTNQIWSDNLSTIKARVFKSKKGQDFIKISVTKFLDTASCIFGSYNLWDLQKMLKTKPLRSLRQAESMINKMRIQPKGVHVKKEGIYYKLISIN